ncbi:MAG: exosortase system-associated protein, TIGR04073 family [Candidatus Omnitrophica bacterium]|nr:exosortase system-associated protein, TIGR04073 family [Candidatus Omnitrophota bacterium]
MKGYRIGIGKGVIFLSLCFSFATPTFAEEAHSSYLDKTMRKLGRGAANVVTFPLELIRTPELIGRKEGYVAAMSAGLAQGLGHALLRGATAIMDVATFYMPFPGDFQPLVQPEFVYAHGDWSE